MAENNTIRTPSGSAGLISYNEETKSKLQITPEMVTIGIVVVIIGMGILQKLLPSI